jgi:uncharacterized membrane protein YqhA
MGTLPIVSISGKAKASTSYVNADLLLAKSIGGSSDDWGRSIAVDSGGNIYTTGHFQGEADFDPGPGTFKLTSVGDQDIFVSKLDNVGNFLWAKSMGGANGDYGVNIVVDSSGNAYTVGYFQGIADFDPGIGTSNLTSAGAADIFVSKLDSYGNFVWTKGMGGNSWDYGFDIFVDSSGNVYTTGSFQDTADFDPGANLFNLVSAGGTDIFISKLDSNGTFLWAKRMGGVNHDSGYSLVVDSSRNVYTTGGFQSTSDFDPGTGIFNLTSVGLPNIFVSKLDSNGSFVWAKSMGGEPDEDIGSSIALDSKSDVYVTGYFRGTADFDPGTSVFYLTSVGENDIFVSKLDNNGSFVWARGMGSLGNDHVYGIAADSSGNVYTTGLFRFIMDFDPGPGTFNLTSAGAHDIYVSKLDSNGIFGWASRIGSIDGEVGFGIVVDNTNKVYTTGSFTGTVDFDPGPGVFNLTTAGLSDIFVISIPADNAMTAADTVGVFRPSNGVIFLKNTHTSGFADVAINYGLAGDYPVVGDWDGDGQVTIGVYRNGRFLLRNSNTVGFAELNFPFGQPGDQPIAGDWDGDGVDTIGVYRPSTGQFLLRNSNDAGPANASFFLGNVGDVGIAGDWDGDGDDTTGVFRPSNGVIFLKNTNDTGFAEVALNYGLPGDKPVVGDWDDNGTTTIGVFRRGQFLLRNSNTNGFAEIVVDLGFPTDMPIVGNWDGLP